MKIGFLADTHFGARNDSTLFNDYFFRFLDDIVTPTIISENIKTVFHAGDVNDRRKYINFNILRKVHNDFFKPLEQMGIDLHVTVGNHDDYFKNTNDLNSVEQLYGHYRNLHIHKETEEITVDGLKFLMVPWITQENQEHSLSMIENSDARIAFGHLQLLGFEMYRGQPAHEGLDPKRFSKFDMVFSGHFHHKSNEGNIFYLGSPWEMTFNDLNDPRGFHIFDTETQELRFIQNPYSMFHRIYYDDTGKTLSQVLNSQNFSKYKDTYVKVVATNKTNPYHFEKFIDSLYRENAADISIIEDFTLESDDESETLDGAEDTMTILSSYVDGLDYSGDKNKIKEILHGLYLEANQMEIN